MTIAQDSRGAARQWGVNPDCLEREVWKNIEQAWSLLKLPAKIRAEDPITRLLFEVLDELMVADVCTPWVLYNQSERWDEAGEISGRTDLEFRYMARRHERYVVECKRLNIPADESRKRSSPNSENYVTDGVLRFVTKQYSAEMPCGGMLGYVMDGEIAKAREALDASFGKYDDALKFYDDRRFCGCSFLPSSPHGALTIHRRGVERFDVHHLLVSVPHRKTS